MKMQNSSYLAFLMIVFIAFGCKKLEPPVVPDDEPDFAVQFIVGEQNISFTAGLNNYYMFSDFDKTGNGLHSFTGELRPISCESNCPNSLKIKIYDTGNSPVSSNVNINESIALDTDYEYVGMGSEDTTYQMIFTPNLPEEAIGDYEYIWTIDGENSSQETVEITKEEPFSTEACLEIIDAVDACNGSICKQVEFNETIDLECFAQIIIADTLAGLDSVRLTVETSDGLLINDILWNTGETLDTIGVNMVDTFSFSGSTDACLITGEGQLNGNLAQPQNVFFCTPNFQTESIRQITPISEVVFGKVVIEYIDANGVFYSSINNTEGGFSNFIVTSLATYDSNERELATVIMNVQFSTTVTSESGLSLEIVEGRGTIGVAYPD